ncbi:MAG: hypothetical protein ACO38I_10075 [Ilumatobacteraceae bacterium]
MTNSTPIAITPNETRTSKSILARLLAREDLNVVFSPSSDTAYFNGATRTLTLPVWENMSDELHDMLVAHEVGHALHTPEGEKAILDAIHAIDPKGSTEAKFYINIVEDARIEQEIKSEFPGSRKSFAIGYRDLYQRGFFELDSIPMNQRTLADRINIHAKIGFTVEVPFDDYEREILNGVMNAKSWEDVVAMAKAVWEYDGTIGRKKIEQAQQAPAITPDNSGDDTEEGNSEDMESGDSSETGETGEDTDSTDSNETGEKGDEKSAASAPSKGDEETEKDENSQSPTAAETVAEFAPPAAPGSARALERNLSGMRNSTALERLYGVLPTPNLENLIVDWKTVHTDLNSWIDSLLGESVQILNQANTLFNTENAKQVNLMVREFERRRTAKAHRRTRTGVRGVLDVNRLHAYKYSEDLFKTYAVTKDGKSHGMVMFVDWSSSMSSVIGDTINQTLSLATFCRKAGIPFEVYAFSSHNPKNFGKNSDQCWSKNEGDLVAFGLTLLNLLSSKMNRREFENATRNLLSLTHYISHNEFVAKAYKNVTGYGPSRYSSGWLGGNYSTGSRVNHYGLGGTPLNAAVLSAYEILPKFRAMTKTQVLTAIFLTDGDATDNVLSAAYDNTGNSVHDANSAAPGNDIGKRHWSVPVYARHRSSRTYFGVNMSKRDQNFVSPSLVTENLLRNLGEFTGARVLGFFISQRKWNKMATDRRDKGGHIYVCYEIDKYYRNDPYDPHDESMAEKALRDVQEAAKNGVLVIPKGPENPYDELYILSSSSMSISEGTDLDDLSSDATITRIRNAFMKQASSGRTSRVFLNRFIPMIAEAL